ncbi:MAG: tetratricopeptide repeat protein [Caulobacterales bacterium]
MDVDAYGRLLERSGDQAGAIALYEEFISNVGENPTIQASLARARAKLPAPKIANPAEGAAIAIFGPAAALTAQTGGEQAAAYLQLALYLDPTLDAARTLLAAGKAEAGRTEDSIDALRQVHPESPYFTTARIEMMWALARMDRNAEAVSAAEETVALAPSLQTRLALADLHRSLEDWQDAARLYDAEIKAGLTGDSEEQARIYFSRGTALERLNRWPEAEADLQKALSLSPNDADVLNYLGYSWIDRGLQIEKAMGLIEKAVALQPESGYIVDSLGWAQYRLGRFDEASATLEDAVELAPGEATINDHLGDAYWQTGRKIEARYQWTRALSLKPTDSEKTAIEAKMKAGLPDAPVKAVASETGAKPITR